MMTTKERMNMERVAIIDLGSNSVRFIIMQIRSGGAYQLIYQEKKAIRLSEGMTQDGMLLTEAAQKRAISCLKVYAHIAAVQKTTKILAVATAAVRNARNGSSFIKRVRTATGLPMTVISGREEARLGYLGVVNTIPLSDFILFDLGGASIEISLVKERKRLHSVSIPIGAVTLTEKFGASGTVSASLRNEISSYVRGELEKLPWLKDAGLPVVGVGGTVRNLAKIHQRRMDYPIPKLHNYQLPASDLFSLTDEISSKTCSERKRISGLSVDRADIIVAGTLLISELVRLAGAKDLTISGCGLREGLFFHYYSPLYMNGRLWPKDMLLASVLNYRHTLPLDDFRHTRYVTALALSMFDQWGKIHHFSPRERQLLMAAGLLHDIGTLVNYYSHARHSAYMIANAHLFGLSHKEQLMCALIAAFHHGYSGKTTRYSSYIRLLTREELQRTKKLAIFLAIAEGLDESHERCVTRLVCSSSPETADLRIYVNQDDFEVPAHAIAPFTRPFEKLFERPLSVQWFPGAKARK